MGVFARHCSEFLFARPSWVEGIARIFDFGNTLNEYNTFNTGNEADGRAIQADWRAVGIDIESACQIFGKHKENIEH